MKVERGPIAERDESELLLALRARDEDAFRLVTDRYRRELLVHCYRMLGSLEDAEDTLQETLLRAWRALDSFEGRSRLRPWLYKIATNLCLDARASRRRRTLPNATLDPASPGDALPGPAGEQLWLQPVPDALIDLRSSVNPEAHYDARESVSLVFLATLQALPSRQRAVLILREVLGWTAAEVAELLGSSVASVNSALQRARTSMKAYRRTTDPTGAGSEQRARLLSRYVDAWQAADAPGLVALLREDVAFTMPPLPLWYRGRAAVEWFLSSQLFAGEAAGRFRLMPADANGSPAFATYQRDRAGLYRLEALQVLTIDDGQIAAVHDFIGSVDRVSARFGVPLTL